MTDEHDSPEADEIRRLLAQARHTEPIPGEVAARLDRVLADLARAPADAPATTPAVVSLSAHRRRRAAGLLVAAAAIVVGGVAVAQQLPHGTSASDATAGSTGDRAAAAGGDNAKGLENSPASAPQVGSKDPLLQQGRIVVRAQHFSADALAGRSRVGTTGAPYADHRDPSTLCIDAPAHSQLLRAVYHHAPAVLVYHQPAGSTQVVDLFVCGSTRPLKSVTLPTG